MSTMRGEHGALVQTSPDLARTVDTRAAAPASDLPRPCQVWSSFTGAWSGGFEIVSSMPTADGGIEFVIRRQTDGWILPGSFSPAYVRTTAGS